MQAVFFKCYEILKIDFTFVGITFCLYDILLYSIIASILTIVVFRLLK